jgi:hypothetical protein
MKKRPTVSINSRLGWRIFEWTALTGVSRATVWRQLKSGQLKSIRVGSARIIPRSEAIRLGLLDAPTTDNKTSVGDIA